MEKAYGGCWCSAMAGGHGAICHLPAGSCENCPDRIAEDRDRDRERD